jgi:hypothetical protein
MCICAVFIQTYINNYCWYWHSSDTCKTSSKAVLKKIFTVFQRVVDTCDFVYFGSLYCSLKKCIIKYNLEHLLFLEKHLSYHFIFRRFFKTLGFLLDFTKYVWTLLIPPPSLLRIAEGCRHIWLYGRFWQLALPLPPLPGLAGAEKCAWLSHLVHLLSSSLIFQAQNESILISVRITPLRC